VALSRPFSRSFQPREPLHRRNGKIRAREVRLIDDAKQQLGVISLDEALKMARAKGMDLIEIVANATPPVCRIVNYGKFLYEEAKRSKDSSRKPANKLKELQISPAIDPHDLAVKLDHAIQFLCDDMKVRVKLRFRGRQKAHKEIGYQVVNKFVKEVALYGQADSPPKMLGDRDLNVLISPLPRQKRAKNPRDGMTPKPAATENDVTESDASDQAAPNAEGSESVPAESVATEAEKVI
jgi:translation initiation factor IF-3